MILGIAGAKQSGKNTRSNFLHGYMMHKKDVLDFYDINDNGELVVSAVFQTPNGPEKGKGVLKLDDDRPAVQEYLAAKVWPYIKQYSFAEPLKEVAISLLGLDRKLVYGNDNDKNTITHLKWENMPGVYTNKKAYIATIEANPDLEEILIYHPEGQMTIREVLQYVGSDIFRRMYPTIWVDYLARVIDEEQPELAIVTDVRYPDEVEFIQKLGGKTICLLRNSDNTEHKSEKITEYKGHDFVIDNRELTNTETNTIFIRKLQEWGIA